MRGTFFRLLIEEIDHVVAVAFVHLLFAMVILHKGLDALWAVADKLTMYLAVSHSYIYDALY